MATEIKFKIPFLNCISHISEPTSHRWPVATVSNSTYCGMTGRFYRGGADGDIPPHPALGSSLQPPLSVRFFSGRADPVCAWFSQSVGGEYHAGNPTSGRAQSSPWGQGSLPKGGGGGTQQAKTRLPQWRKEHAMGEAPRRKAQHRSGPASWPGMSSFN